MDSKLWIRKALSSCLCVAVLVTYSMVALANSGKIAGELTVSGKNVKGETPFVLINGETAKSGRSVFSSSTIVTPDDATAVVSLGKLGKIELAPKSTVTLSFDGKSINSELTAGQITVLGAAEGVGVKTADGNTVKLLAGESLTASGKAQTGGGGGAAWWVWAAVFGGAAVGIIYAATRADNRVDLGGNGTVVSPTR